MKKIAIIILLISMLAGCGKKQISMDFSEEERVETSVAEGTAGDTIYVYISGQVKKPGVYQVQKDARMFEVIQKAGGFTKKPKATI
jgi:competence protein ComEA